MTTNPILPSTPANTHVPAITFPLMLCLAALCSGIAGAQTLSSGGNYDGTILLGQTNTWMFSATVGDRIVLRGAALTTTNNFEPWLRIYNPSGVLIADSGINSSVAVEELDLTATNSGTFMVLVNDTSFGGFIGTGAYRLYFAQFPGTFVVPSGDDGGSLANGGNYDGTIQLGDLDLWSFTANVGDRVVLRGASLTSTNNFEPWLRIYGPDGVLIRDSGVNSSVDVEELDLIATNSGTYTVLMADTAFGGFDGTGTYRLYFAQLPGTFVVPSGDDGGSLASGGNYNGTIQLGDLDFWSFTANLGDRVVLRGAALTSTNNFEPWLRIYGPDGVLLLDSGVNSSVDVEELDLTATNSGTFTVLMTDTGFGGFDGTGAYRLYFAQLPGSFVVPPGDEGGSLTNGGNFDGTIQLGDLDLWSFTANAGDRVVLRGASLTSINDFEPWLRIYGPDGVLLRDSGVNSSVAVEELDLTATNSGTFTGIMTDSGFGLFNGTGAYRLYFAHLPGAFGVGPGDQGGSMIAGADSLGTILLGDLDLWRFTACKGDAINLQVNQLSTTNTFNPWLRLYGPTGALIVDSGVNNSGVTAHVTVAATNGGTLTVIVTDSGFGGFDGTGTYQLSSNGLADGLKLCFPTFPGNNVALAEVGGVPGATFVLFTQTNIAAPAALWTPIYTNQFDSFGVGSETNAFSRSERQRYFHLDPQ